MRRLVIKICDDEKYFVDELQTLIVAAGNDLGYEVQVKAYVDVEELLENMIEQNEECHILFLDVEMPKLMGDAAARKLRQAGYEGVICFVTSHNRYALEAYQVDALGYISKPAQYDAVKKLIKRACIEVFYRIDEEEAKKRYLEVASQGNKHIVDLQRVLYIEKRRNQSIIHMVDGELSCYEPLKNLYTRLNHEKFVYAHQGFIANFDKIKEVRSDSIQFGEGCEIPVSRRYQKELRERHIDMIRKIRINGENKC